MVHTRGQPRFAEGDRVLCYEPDNTKVQVLYEAKVLEVVERKEGVTGRRSVDCLVHFQGWNSGWDRYVAEDQILEYNDANRRLQRTLAETLLPPGVVERRRYSGTDSQCSSTCGGAGAGGAWPSSGGGGGGGGGASQATSETASTGSESDAEPAPAEVAVDLPAGLRRRLDDDFHYVNRYHRLHRLPCGTTVLHLLEAYVHHWHRTGRPGVSSGAGRPAKPSSARNAWTDAATRSLSVCKEVVDGLRVVFDHVLELQLLYAPEREQHAQMCVTAAAAPAAAAPAENAAAGAADSVSRRLRSRRSALHITGSPDRELRPPPAPSADAAVAAGGGGAAEEVDRPAAAATAVVVVVRGASSEEDEPPPKRRLVSVDSSVASSAAAAAAGAGGAAELAGWTLLPPSEQTRNPPLPCTVYGATHLLRLIAVLPELLLRMHLSERKLSVVVHHVLQLVQFLQDSTDQLCGRACYS